MFARDLAFRGAAMRWVCLLGRELQHRLEVVRLPLEFTEWIDQPTQAGNFFDVGLRTFPVRPEVRRSHALLKRG